MARLKVVLLLSISCASILSQSSSVKVASPDPSIEIFFSPLPQDATNQSAAAAAQTTVAPTISGIIHASLNNVLRIPLPIWGTVGIPGNGAPTLSQVQQQQPSLAAQVTGGENLSPDQRQQLAQQQQPQQIGVYRKPDESQGAPPTSFLPLPIVNQAISSTIAQLSTLTHWPFGYITTTKPQQQPVRSTAPATVTPVKASTQRTTTTPVPTHPPTTTTTAATTTTVKTTTVPSTPVAPPPLPPVNPTQAMAPPPPPTPPPFIFPSNGGPSFSFPPPVQPAPTTRPSLPSRIHNRIHSTIGNYIRLPNLSQIGQPRPRPMLTEPPWVTELLGPTLEPPTTRAPTLGERVQNSIQNVLLFVPATLLNFWYENWGTQHVDRFINRLQLSTPRPGSPASPVFATISQNGPNPFANFSTDSLGGVNGSSSSNPSDFPAIAAFINTNGTLMPTIVHPVVNKTANTIEYQLRSENETTVLWTGTLSNDVFFGNKKSPEESVMEIDDEEEEQIKNIALNIKKE